MDEDAFDISPEWVLPLDLTAGPKPNPGNYTENGYEDASIRVRLEEIVYDEKTTLHVAYIQIADASQFRTGVVNPSKLGTTKTETVAYMAKKYNAVIALNGDYYVDDPDKTTFEYRMTTKIRGKRNRTKDILIIDDAGDFHFYIKSKGLDDAPAELKAAGRKLVNGFTFGPALIADGELLDLDDNYGYNPHGHEPRTAIGQTGPLSYVFVVVSCKGRNDGSGLSHSQLAEEMLKLGCINGYNLDGGNSAEMIFGEKMIKGSPNASQRGLSDIIYFATLVPEE